MRKADTWRAVARVAAQLAREHKGVTRTIPELADDAVTLVRAAMDARLALERQRQPRRAYARARAVADTYEAELIEQGEVDGMVVGLRLRSGAYSCGANNTFYVA